MAAAAIPTQQGMITTHTVRKSQIMSKNSIFRKIQNSEFEFLMLKSHDF